MYNHFEFSLLIKNKSINQFTHSAIFIHFFVVLVTVLYIAIAEITRKIKSILDHHIGFKSQQCEICVCVTNKKGVARQCSKQKPLDSTPMVSDLVKENIILNTNATKLQ